MVRLPRRPEDPPRRTQKRAFAGGRHPRVGQAVERESSTPFTWTKTAEEISTHSPASASGSPAQDTEHCSRSSLSDLVFVGLRECSGTPKVRGRSHGDRSISADFSAAGSDSGGAASQSDRRVCRCRTVGPRISTNGALTPHRALKDIGGTAPTTYIQVLTLCERSRWPPLSREGPRPSLVHALLRCRRHSGRGRPSPHAAVLSLIPRQSRSDHPCHGSLGADRPYARPPVDSETPGIALFCESIDIRLNAEESQEGWSSFCGAEVGHRCGSGACSSAGSSARAGRVDAPAFHDMGSGRQQPVLPLRGSRRPELARAPCAFGVCR